MNPGITQKIPDRDFDHSQGQQLQMAILRRNGVGMARRAPPYPELRAKVNPGNPGSPLTVLTRFVGGKTPDPVAAGNHVIRMEFKSHVQIRKK
jgi:hypothetical protein